MGNVYGIGYQWKMHLLFELFYCCLLLKWLIAAAQVYDFILLEIDLIGAIDPCHDQ